MHIIIILNSKNKQKPQDTSALALHLQTFPSNNIPKINFLIVMVFIYMYVSVSFTFSTLLNFYAESLNLLHNEFFKLFVLRPPPFNE